MHPRLAPWLALLLLLPFAAVGDVAASHDWGRPTSETPPGTYSGVFEPMLEMESWLVRHPAGKEVRATLTVDGATTTDNLTLDVLGPEGHGPKDSAAVSLGGKAPPSDHAFGADPSGLVTIEFRSFGGSDPVRFEYTLTLEVVDLPDYRVVAFSIEKPDPSGSVLDQDARTVRITVANDGVGAGKGWISFNVRTNTDLEWVLVGWVRADIAPGESREAVFQWDVRHYLGTVQVQAATGARAEALRHDNEAASTHVVLTRANGLGAHVTTEHACRFGPCAGTTRDGETTIVYASAGPVAAVVYARPDGVTACGLVYATYVLVYECLP